LLKKHTSTAPKTDISCLWAVVLNTFLFKINQAIDSIMFLTTLTKE